MKLRIIKFFLETIAGELIAIHVQEAPLFFTALMLLLVFMTWALREKSKK